MAAIKAVMPKLSPDERMRLSAIELHYLRVLKQEGLYERFNNRTVGQIFAEVNPAMMPKLIASGKIDGISYQLFDSAADDTKSNDAVSQ